MNSDRIVAVVAYVLLLAFGVYAVVVKVFKLTDVLGLLQ